MIFLNRFPLVGLELQRMARRGSTHSARLGMIALFAVPLAMAWAWQTFWAPNTQYIANDVGQRIAWGVLIVQAGVAFIVTANLAASALTTEKDDRTLPLLLMADLRGWDIILAKFVSVFFRSALAILSVAPFGAFAILLGGVDLFTLCWMTAQALISAACVAAIGIYLSTVLAQSNVAAVLTFLMVLFWLGITLWIDAKTAITGIPVGINPYTFIIFGFVFGRGAVTFQMSLTLLSLLPLIAGVLFLFAAVRALPAQLYAAAEGRIHRKGTIRRSSIYFWRSDPVARLVSACAGRVGFARRALPLRILSYFALGAVALIPGIGCVIIYSVLYREVSLAMMALRKEGALDDFVLIPISDRELGVRVWQGFARSTRIFFGAVVVSLMLMYALSRIGGGAYVIAALVPVILAQYACALATACWAGTLRESLIGLGMWPFGLLLLFGVFAPPAVYMFVYYVWIYRGDPEIFMSEAYDRAINVFISFPAFHLYIALNFVLFAAAAWFFCAWLGKRLRRRPLLEWRRTISRPEPA